MAENEETRRGTVDRLRASSAALSALPRHGRTQQKTFFPKKKCEVCRQNTSILYWTCNCIRSDPNTKSLGSGARFRKRQERKRRGGLPGRVLVAGEGPEDGDLSTWRRAGSAARSSAPETERENAGVRGGDLGSEAGGAG